MEVKLRYISKFCWYAIVILIIIYIYRKPHEGDYLYNVRIFSTKIAVAAPGLQIIELKASYNQKSEKDYSFNEVGYNILTSENGIREAELKNSWEEDNLYTNLCYYSLSEQKAYVAHIPLIILDEMEKSITKTREKKRYFKVYYNIHSDGLIVLDVKERSKKDGKNYSIYKSSYQAKKFKSTDKLLSEITKRIPVPLEQWDEVVKTKYNWGISVETDKDRYLGKISITTFTDDDYSYKRKGGGSNYTYNLKVLPQYITIWTEHENGKSAGFEELKFDFNKNKKIFDEVYRGKDPDDRSTITINLGRDGKINDSVTLSLDNVKTILSLQKK